MHLYFSATPKNDKYQVAENGLCTHRLFSLHGTYEQAVLNWMTHVKNGVIANMDKPRPKCILLDSGAFTAWKSGHVTTVEEVISSYSKFLSIAKEFFDEIWAINLDVIPGSFGRDPTLDEIKEAIRVSDINFKILTDTFGNRILPVYHQGEPLERAHEVEELTEKTSRYICVSPRNDLHEKLRVDWSQQVHAKLKKETRTHGLATTGNLMLDRVPWYSVDSATWVSIGIYGGIIHFWDTGLTSKYTTIAISNEGGRDRIQGQHFDSIPDPFKEAITQRAKLLGFTPEEMKTNHRLRCLYNIYNLEMYANKIRLDKKKHTYQATLFGV